MSSRSPGLEIVTGRARVDRRTKRLITRLHIGEIAIIDHADIDRIAAEGLLEREPAAVLNATSSITGRYPSVGAMILTEAGIPLLDECGPGLMNIHEGSQLTVRDDQVFIGGEFLLSGLRQTAQSTGDRVEAAKAGLGIELQAFAENTLRYVREESHLLFDPPDPPDLGIELKGRHVMVVVRGHNYREDISHLRGYVRDMKPVVIAVDGGADVCLAEGLSPDIVIGDFDSVSDDALRCGAKLVVHAYVTGEAPGAKRLEAMELPFVTYEAPGMSEDVAMLLAYDEGAELIVAVGTHASMIEFLDKGREGMASTFLTRLKVGPILVDAKGVSRLYHGTLGKRDLTFLVSSAVVVFLVMGLVSADLRTFIDAYWFLLGQFFGDLVDAVSFDAVSFDAVSFDAVSFDAVSFGSVP